MTETTAAPASVADTLRAAKALIDTPEKWTRGQLARTKSGHSAVPAHPKAVMFCMVGALLRIDGPHQRAAHHALEGQVLVGSLPDFNDARGRKHAEVMEAFDRAIALAESKS